MKSLVPKGWVLLTDAAAESGMHPETMRNLVRGNIFTRGQFTAGRKKAPIYLKRTELNAFKSGGVPAVEAVRRKAKRARQESRNGK